MRNGQKSYILVVLILFLATILRTFNLNTVPPGITNDEVSAVYNGYTIARTGKDIANQSIIKAIFLTPQNYPQAEFPAIFLAPFMRFLNLTLPTARLPYALVGVLTIFLLYLIILQLTQSTYLALTSMFVMALSPWHIHVSRTAFEAPLSLFFLLSALVAILYKIKGQIIIASSSLILAFLSYQGTKLTVIPFLLLTIWLKWPAREKRWRMIIILSSLILFIALFTTIFFKYSPAVNRLAEIDMFNVEDIAKIVNDERSQSLLSAQVIPIFSNKAVVIIRQLFNKFFGLFSPEFLFLKGEQRSSYSLWFHGVLYPIDFFLMLIGFAHLYQYKKRIWLWAVLLILIGSIPSLVSTVGQSYVFRSLLTAPAFTIFIGAGLFTFSMRRKKKFVKVSFVSLISLLYSFSLVNYLAIYHGRYPVYGSSGFFLSDRILASYLQFMPENKKIFIRVPEPEKHYLQFAFYHLIDPETVQNSWRKQQYVVDNYIFTDKCPEQGQNDIILIYHKDRYPCRQQMVNETVSTITTDALRTWIIESDQICESFSLSMNQFLFPKKVADYQNLDTVSKEQLCLTWFFTEQQAPQT